MSGMGDAFAALKNVVLLHERIAELNAKGDRMADDLKALTLKVHTLDKRVYGIEAIIGFARGGASLPQIEG